MYGNGGKTVNRKLRIKENNQHKVAFSRKKVQLTGNSLCTCIHHKDDARHAEVTVRWLVVGE